MNIVDALFIESVSLAENAMVLSRFTYISAVHLCMWTSPSEAKQRDDPRFAECRLQVKQVAMHALHCFISKL